MLKPQDLLVTLKLSVLGVRGAWTYKSLAESLGMSASELHAAVKRAEHAGLLAGVEVRTRNLLEFLEHGVRYSFPVQRGTTTRGMPTGVGAPPLDALFDQTAEPPVWPDPHGKVRGYALSPLYKSVPFAASQDAELYQLLALTDAVREAVPREAKQAIKVLHVRLGKSSAALAENP